MRIRVGWPRLGRWAVQPGVRGGLLLHALPTAEAWGMCWVFRCRVNVMLAGLAFGAIIGVLGGATGRAAGCCCTRCPWQQRDACADHLPGKQTSVTCSYFAGGPELSWLLSSKW